MKYKFVASWLLSAMFAFGVLANMQSESFGQNQERGMRGGQRGQRGQGGQRGGQRGGRGDDGSALVKGEVAPDFVLKSLDGKSETKLSDFRGKKPVILIFGSYTWPPFMNSVGTMETMYQKYKDVAEFRMIYIREAHAVDSARPSGLGRQLNIKDHTDYDSRCDVAERLIKDKKLTMPMLIDNFENTTDLAYQAKPDRVFLVGSDGRLAVAADRGPFGFAPGLTDCKTWLDKFVTDKKEPELSKETIATADAKTKKRGPAKKPTPSKSAPSESTESTLSKSEATAAPEMVE